MNLYDLSICVPVLNRSHIDVPGFGSITPFPNAVDSLIAAVKAARIRAELCVCDFGSTDWPLRDWLPARVQAAGIPCNIISTNETYSHGLGKNAAAESANAPVLFFTETDMLVPPAVIQRGLAVAADGKGFFPLYQRFHDATHSASYWGCGNGCNIVRKEHWAVNRWQVTPGWGNDEDTAFAKWFADRNLYVREKIDGFLHQWHPSTPEKLAVERQRGQ